ncbi:ammonium transporter, partial [Haematococcus lacustris]
MVFIMHGGFAMLCAGAIRSKNTLNILLQTIMDACVSAIAFYIVGFGFAYGVVHMVGAMCGLMGAILVGPRLGRFDSNGNPVDMPGHSATLVVLGTAWDLISMCNGVLVGFVVITACAHVVEPWAAIVNGICGGLFFDLVCWLFLKLRIDDPLSAVPMHGFGGMWGVFFTGLLAKQEYVQQAYGTGMSVPYQRGEYYGLFYGGGGRLLASQ